MFRTLLKYKCARQYSLHNIRNQVKGKFNLQMSGLQNITESVSTHSLHSERHSTNCKVGHSVIPINDIHDIRYLRDEKLFRCKLAAVYRLVDLYGWSFGIYNHITARVGGDAEHFLLNPFGIHYPEVTASALLKVDMEGNVIDPGSTTFDINRAGFVIHSAIHSARPDIRAVMHLHHPPCVAVSAMKCGLLAVSQEAAIVGEVSYHDYRGLVIDPEERKQIVKNLGPTNKVIILRNHGVVTCGESIEEALYIMQNLVKACETQISLISVGLDNIQIMSNQAKEQVHAIVEGGGARVQGKPVYDEVVPSNQNQSNEESKKWKIWDLEFEAQMRMLDNAGYKTGHLYRQPLIRPNGTKKDYERNKMYCRIS